MTATLRWFTSSHSTDTGGNCVEVAYDWHTSSHSSQAGGNCIEVAAHQTAVHVRDSKDPDGPMLTFPAGSWAVFVNHVNSGGFAH
ncbi:DUF397 domain-containing protein [Actinacidiphila yeochonensis]|uniref:DUF397 domain-containing protein n=1 Tax=Actinacidiphila yeochonensis TaxID=89050 RepID=UPI00056668E8|nr:DUF397 domain-containing protein [Actinacidiphila yeochonensis]